MHGVWSFLENEIKRIGVIILLEGGISLRGKTSLEDFVEPCCI
jgi:hypothetical protein